ncbi:MAG: MltA domain-containing protein [Arenicellales bacterium]|nr:MltA domain-containing protein [Arenicellales bacterium]
MAIVKLIILFYSMVMLIGCALITPGPGIGKPVNWSDLKGWQNDKHAETWTSLLRSCEKLQELPEWKALCQVADSYDNPTDQQAKMFYEEWFIPYPVYAIGGTRKGLITGYYEPLLFGSLEETERFRFAVYQRPQDLLTIDLSDVYPELKGKRVRGRLDGTTVVSYYNRATLDSNPELLNGNELVWVDDPVALFFLHVQGSGRVQLPDGTILGIGYADQNGHPYKSIGRELIDMGELDQEDVNLFSIRQWLRDNPGQVKTLFERNPSYVFFTTRTAPEEGPYGSLNVPLVAERAIAVDRSVIPLGLPVWLETTVPGSKEPYRRLVLAQDTGGAIKGHVRADLFWGQGPQAERMAGLMKEEGRLFVLKPKAQ